MVTLPKVVVAYQGQPGAYSEQAAKELLGENISTIGLDTFENCFVKLYDGKCDFAMLPIENSMGGSVHDIFDLQVRFDFHIVAEIDFRVKHCLLALPQTKFEDINYVISHPQALAQCEKYLRKMNLTAQKEYDTAGSAKKINEGNITGYAAIASKLAATVHNLIILDEVSHFIDIYFQGIEDDPNNVTRFFLLSKQCLIPPTAYELLSYKNIMYKTSIVLSFENIPGALCRTLSFFAENGIDLTKLESRPNKTNSKGIILPTTLPSELLELFSRDGSACSTTISLVKYPFIFYLDLIGSITEHRIIAALIKISATCQFFRVLGSFPRGGVLQQFVAKMVGVKNNSVISHLSSVSAMCRTSLNSVQEKKTIAIIGFGNFGIFLTRTFIGHHKVVACNRSNKSIEALKLGITYYDSPTELLKSEKNVDIVVFCTAILAFEAVLSSIDPNLLEGKLLVDVLSVKDFPKTVLCNYIKKFNLSSSILCTHPMFGPESGKLSWSSLPMVFDQVSILSESHQLLANTFLKIFSDEGCNMVEMTCEKHDKKVADSQFITHFLGRTIDLLELQTSGSNEKEISTVGFKSLLNIRDQTVKDSFNLFSALYLYNPNAKTTVQNLKMAIDSLVASLNPKTTKEVSLFEPSRIIAGISSSKTGEIFAAATELKENGIDIELSLCVGEPDFLPPKAVLDATRNAATDGYTKYTPTKGYIKLRDAIRKDLYERKQVNFHVENIMVVPSAKQALYLSLCSILNPGDEVVIPAPYWTSYPEMVKLFGGKPVYVKSTAAENYVLDLNKFKTALSSKTRALILCNPCNPTGVLLEKEQLKKLAGVLKSPQYKNIVVITDEIYERLLFDDHKHTCFANIEGMKDRTVIINGFSKAYAMTGYRIGYIAASKSLIRSCAKLQSQLNSCACSISQMAAVAALQVPEPDLKVLYLELQVKRDLIINLLRTVPNIVVPEVAGAFYVLPEVSYYFGLKTKSNKIIATSNDLCVYLMEEFLVALVPGDALGAPGGVRFSFAASKKSICRAVERFKIGLASLER